MSRVPAAILTEILCRLRVKCLLRLKCVSRSWHALISSPQFVKLHLNRSAETKINLGLFLWRYKLYRLDFDSLEDEDADTYVEVVDNHPLNSGKDLIQIWGSCNGLICMSNSNDSTVFLWNPSTRKSIKLPHESVEVPNLSEFEQKMQYGITYTCNDYRVGRVVGFKNSNGEFLDYEVKVYSLRSNSWHTSDKFHHPPDLDRTEITVVGSALHWISRLESEPQKESLIIAFDLGTEKYREIRQPEFQDPHSPTYLHSLGECLSVTCQNNSVTADIWVLKNYGEKNEYWFRLIRKFPRNPALVMPVAYSRCGKKVMLLIGYEKLICYDLEQNPYENKMALEYVMPPNVLEENNTFKVITCLESLVCVDVALNNAINPQEDE